MPLPVGFDTWEHLQQTLMSLQNRMITEEFRGIEDHDDISVPRSSLKAACWLRDADTTTITLLKLFLFHSIIKGNELLPIYAIPVAKFKSEAVAYKPQCFLKFVSDPNDDNMHERGVLEAEISFRLMWENTSVSQIKSLALKIHSELATPPYVWKKGVDILSYRDVKRGYELRLYVPSFQIGEAVVKKILNIQNHPFELEFCNYSESKSTFPVNPGTKVVLGKTQKKIRRRPIGNVTFYSADFDWGDLNEPIRLVGPLGRRRRGSPELLYK